MLTNSTSQLTNHDVPDKLVMSYHKHLRISRGISPITIRNYIQDLSPFFEYLTIEGVLLDGDARELKQFIERYGDRNVSQTYRRLVRDFVTWLVESRKLKSGSRRGKIGHERSSVIRTLASLRSFIRWLIEENDLPESPLWERQSSLMRNFTPRIKRRLPDVLSTREISNLLAAPALHKKPNNRQRAAALRDSAILELLYSSGLRVSEITGLGLNDIDLKLRTVRVWGKGSKGRMVPVGIPAVRAVSVYIDQGRPFLTAKDSISEPLFINQRGARLKQRSIQSIVQQAGIRSNTRLGIHPHTIRHSFATHLLDGGADLRIVQELLGHSTPSATQVYTHVSQLEARRAYFSAHPLARKSRDRKQRLDTLEQE